MNMKAIKRKLEIAIKKAESMKLKNNFFIFWKGKETEETVTDNSLVILLTEYEDIQV